MQRAELKVARTFLSAPTGKNACLTLGALSRYGLPGISRTQLPLYASVKPFAHSFMLTLRSQNADAFAFSPCVLRDRRLSWIPA